MGQGPQKTGSVRDRAAQLFEKENVKGVEAMANEVAKCREELGEDEDLLSYMEGNTKGLMKSSCYDLLHDMYRTEEYGYETGVVNVVVRSGLGKGLGERLRESESGHPEVVEKILEYLGFLLDKVKTHVPKFRLLYEEPVRSLE